MAVTSHVIRDATVMGSQRVILGEFVLTADANGDVPTSLARVSTWHSASAGVVDNNIAIFRNSTTTAEYSNSPTVPHLGGNVHIIGGDNSGDPVYRYVAWGK